MTDAHGHMPIKTNLRGTFGGLMTPAEAASFLSITPKVLERWRGIGEGPSFVRLSRKSIRYRREDVEEFVTQRVKDAVAPS